jgi:hypothetical protein
LVRTRRLIVVTPEGERELLFIGRLTVGRAPECDISLADTKISRRHAEFDASGPAPRVTDLGSRNGILVNGRKVGAADLAPGDVVTAGDARIRFEERAADTQAPAAPAPPPMADDRTAVIAPAFATAPVTPPVAMPLRGASPDPDKTRVMPPPAAPLAATAPSEHASAEYTLMLAPPGGGGVAAPPARTPAPRGPAAAAGVATGRTLTGPRVPWVWLVTLAAMALGGLAVLLGALPPVRSSTIALEAQSLQQARALAGWLAAGVHPQASPVVVDPVVLDAVSAQPGVSRVLVLDRASGRAVAPASVVGQAFDELPTVGAGWRDLTAVRTGRTETFTDAYVPAGGGAYVAWVRYERRPWGSPWLAVLLALVVTFGLALATAMLVTHQTRVTLQHFTQQLERAVSGASPGVMQGGLLPGLDRLTTVVTPLLERTQGSARGRRHGASTLFETDDPDLSPANAGVSDPGPPWLIVTPSLQVIQSSGHAPAAGAAAWASATGRHLLDILETGPIRNAVVEGLGALGMQAGAEASVPLAGAPSVTLRRESSGHVRVTVAMR